MASPSLLSAIWHEIRSCKYKNSRLWHFYGNEEPNFPRFQDHITRHRSCCCYSNIIKNRRDAIKDVVRVLCITIHPWVATHFTALNSGFTWNKHRNTSNIARHEGWGRSRREICNPVARNNSSIKRQGGMDSGVWTGDKGNDIRYSLFPAGVDFNAHPRNSHNFFIICISRFIQQASKSLGKIIRFLICIPDDYLNRNFRGNIFGVT